MSNENKPHDEILKQVFRGLQETEEHFYEGLRAIKAILENPGDASNVQRNAEIALSAMESSETPYDRVMEALCSATGLSRVGEGEHDAGSQTGMSDVQPLDVGKYQEKVAFQREEEQVSKQTTPLQN